MNPTPWQSPPPSAADTVTMAVAFTLTAAAAPTAAQAAALKSAVASWLSVEATALMHFATIAVDDGAATAKGAHRRATQAAAPNTARFSGLRRLSAVTWAVSFHLSESLAASGAGSAGDFVTATAAALADAAFEAAASAAVGDATVAVNAASVSAVALTRGPTASPTLTPSPPPTNATATSAADDASDSGSDAGYAAAGTVAVFLGALLLLVALAKALLAWQRKVRARGGFDAHDDKQSLFQASVAFSPLGNRAALPSASPSSFAEAEAEEAHERKAFASRSGTAAASASKAATNMLTVARHAEQNPKKVKDQNAKVKGRHQRLQNEEDGSDDERGGQKASIEIEMAESMGSHRSPIHDDEETEEGVEF